MQYLSDAYRNVWILYYLALGYQSTDSIIIQGDEAKETLSDELVIRLPVGARGTPSSQREDLENGEHAESNVDRDEGLVIRCVC